jgi:hypothetical protein
LRQTYCADEYANIKLLFSFFKIKKPYILERAGYIRFERKKAAQNCHQVHSVDILLTVENKSKLTEHVFLQIACNTVTAYSSFGRTET